MFFYWWWLRVCLALQLEEKIKENICIITNHGKFQISKSCYDAAPKLPQIPHVHQKITPGIRQKFRTLGASWAASG